MQVPPPVAVYVVPDRVAEQSEPGSAAPAVVNVRAPAHPTQLEPVQPLLATVPHLMVRTMSLAPRAALVCCGGVGREDEHQDLERIGRV